jgi:uncharacterized protein
VSAAAPGAAERSRPLRESDYNIWTERPDAVYLWNGVSGALLKMDAADRKAVEAHVAGLEEPRCSRDLLERLIRGRMIVRAETDEIAVLKRRYEWTAADTESFALTLVTSLGCNFDCPYCFEAKHPSLMEKPVQEQVLLVLEDQLPRIRQFDVTWFGGEPLAGKKALFSLSEEFQRRCAAADVAYAASIITNGYLLDGETAAKLREAGVGGAQVGVDGPPEIHDRMRPLVSGKGTFWRIVANLHAAAELLDVSVRVNIDRSNFDHVEELLQILKDEGLGGKVGVNAGQIVAIDDHEEAPSASYGQPCFSSPDFAAVELEFNRLVQEYGFGSPQLPAPTGAPCTAVRHNELVVGSKGELYKCWDSVGNMREVIGHVSAYRKANSRLAKWLSYSPFEDEECRGCVALPVCMGGCAHHAMDPIQYENRCGTFRHTYRQQIQAFVDAEEEAGATGPSAPAARKLC